MPPLKSVASLPRDMLHRQGTAGEPANSRFSELAAYVAGALGIGGPHTRGLVAEPEQQLLVKCQPIRCALRPVCPRPGAGSGL